MGWILKWSAIFAVFAMMTEIEGAYKKRIENHFLKCYNDLIDNSKRCLPSLEGFRNLCRVSESTGDGKGCHHLQEKIYQSDKFDDISCNTNSCLCEEHGCNKNRAKCLKSINKTDEECQLTGRSGLMFGEEIKCYHDKWLSQKTTDLKECKRAPNGKRNACIVVGNYRYSKNEQDDVQKGCYAGPERENMNNCDSDICTCDADGCNKDWQTCLATINHTDYMYCKLRNTY